MDIYSSEPCPRCNGSGRRISHSSLNALALKSKKSKKDIAQSMRITPQFLCDLLKGRRDWTSNLVRAFLGALGKVVQDD